MSLPKRTDDIYKEIENFEDYEYTNCIAYEMAIRNKIVRDIKSKIINKEIDRYDEKIEQELEVFGLSIHDYKLFNDDISRYKFLEKENESAIYSYYPLSSVKDAYDKLLKFLYDENNIYEEVSLHSFEYKKINMEYGDWIKSLFEKKKSYYFTFNNRFFYRISSNVVNELVVNKLGEKFIKLLSDDELKYMSAKTSMICSRWELNFVETIEMDIKININLPKNEIIDYISKIKDGYDEHFSESKNPLELFSEQIKEISNNPLMNVRTGKIDKIKVADMFFIYDCIKQGMKKSKIQMELSYYYSDNFNKDSLYDQKTINKYLDIAIDYVDNLKYKELITGVKE